MAKITSGQYEARVRIDDFKGLYQDTEAGVDMSYAMEAVNLKTDGGGLETVTRSLPLGDELPSPIITLMRLHRRYAPTDKNILIAASGGRLYWATESGGPWQDVAMPDGMGSYASDAWSWVTYEINPPGADAPIDVLLLSNAVDGMVMVRGDDLTASRIETPRKFGVISRYAERIWGGAIAGDPDMLVYSAPFDPTNWEADVNYPEDGAGDVLQPSWDGDSFTAILQFGSQLIAMKRTRVWRILGTDPGEFVFKEQYGGGAMYERTIAADGEKIFMLGDEGVCVYDGLTVSPYYPQFARDIYARMNKAALPRACGCAYKGSYYCALPLDGATENNAILIYSTEERTWLLREGIYVRDFLPAEGRLYYTSGEEPRQVYTLNEGFYGEALPAKWVSPWQDHSRADVRKGGFIVYLTPYAETATEIYITMQTEKKKKTKTLRVRPPASKTKGPMQKRIQFGGAGRRWRITIESRKPVPWRLIGGMQIDVETDPD